MNHAVLLLSVLSLWLSVTSAIDPNGNGFVYTGDNIADKAKLLSIPQYWNPLSTNSNPVSLAYSSCGISWLDSNTFSVTNDGSSCDSGRGAYVLMTLPHTVILNMTVAFLNLFPSTSLSSGNIGVTHLNRIPEQDYQAVGDFGVYRNFSDTSRIAMLPGFANVQYAKEKVRDSAINVVAAYNRYTINFYKIGDIARWTARDDTHGFPWMSYPFHNNVFQPTQNLTMYMRFSQCVGLNVRVSYTQKSHIVSPVSVGMAQGGSLPDWYLQMSTLTANRGASTLIAGARHGRLNNLYPAFSGNKGAAILTPDLDYIQTTLNRKTYITDVLLQANIFSYPELYTTNQMAFYSNFTLLASTTFTPASLLFQSNTVGQLNQTFAATPFTTSVSAFRSSDFVGGVATSEITVSNWAPVRRITLSKPVVATALRFTPSRESIVDVTTGTVARRSLAGPYVRLDYLGIDDSVLGPTGTLGQSDPLVIPDAYMQASECPFCPFMLRPSDCRLRDGTSFNSAGFIGSLGSQLQVLLPAPAMIHGLVLQSDNRVTGAFIYSFRVFYSTTLTAADLVAGPIYNPSNDAKFMPVLDPITGAVADFSYDESTFNLIPPDSYRSTGGSWHSFGVPFNATAIRIMPTHCSDSCFLRFDIQGRYIQPDFAPPTWLQPTTQPPTVMPTTAPPTTPVPTTRTPTWAPAVNVSLAKSVRVQFQVFAEDEPTADVLSQLRQLIAQSLGVGLQQVSTVNSSSTRLLSVGIRYLSVTFGNPYNEAQSPSLLAAKLQAVLSRSPADSDFAAYCETFGITPSYPPVLTITPFATASGFPSTGAPTTATPSSDSGVSNTTFWGVVIGLIATGAIMLALIVWCISSRYGSHMPLKESSGEI
jgi:hypothetical protein